MRCARRRGLLDDVAFLAVDSPRARAYLEALRERDLLPAFAVLLAGEEDGGGTPIREMLAESGVAFADLPTEDVNAPEVVAAVAARREKIFLYAGPAGGILKEPFFETGKKFLHVHAGTLPDFRGSTTIYYQLLARGDCGATALFLERKIDAGPVLAERTFPPPEDGTTIDREYDPKIRAALLVEVLEKYRQTGRFEERPQESTGETYYVVHPVLKHLAILTTSRRRPCAKG